MFFMIASIIIGISASLITIKTLVGYTSLKWWVKLLAALFIIFCWFAHCGLRYLKHNEAVSVEIYKIASTTAYVGLGFGFILLVLILVRDFSWFAGYGVAKLAKSGYSERINPFNNFYLNVANVVTLFLAICLTGWGMYEAMKFPDIKTVTVQDAKIKKPMKLVQINDLHINRTTSVSKIENFVEKVNGLEADVIVLVGDIVDEKPDMIKEQMETLAKLKAKQGVFTVFGNHDFYSGFFPWMREFIRLKMGLLFNNGVAIDNNIYLAGIPDKSVLSIPLVGGINIEKAISGNKDDLYTILLSHTPNFSKEKISDIDLQLSGHTHGGQIFPFHFLVKSANKYLSGMYQEDGYKIYVSRGAGYWGPPIRLFAPSEITVFNLEPEK